MTTSMTAFARLETELEGNQLIWEIRSVNHRYLDIILKLPEQLRALDTSCRKQITEGLKRGRIDAHFKIEQSNALSPQTTIDFQSVKALVNLLEQIERANSNLQPAKTTDILRWPGVISENQIDRQRLNKHTLTALQNCISQLVENRRREGGRLANMIEKRVVQCRKIVAQLMGNIDQIQQKIQDKWQRRIEAFTHHMDQNIDQVIDQGRMAQEITILLTKTDVSEELDRLQMHLTEVEHHLQAGKPAGRNLDFLMQELNREANTLGAKSVDQQVTNAAIELKVLIDQMREQVQNLE
ncbi:YicC/YloC family endoribonuclease [Candidatus Spongiihabitans sp.]|uniref:YicC/YloC family endoribonuclease n=1 Tax=Candidatus Spongiihabitans sp. TaxID=3101308 RepID=UPI003C6F7699